MHRSSVEDTSDALVSMSFDILSSSVSSEGLLYEELVYSNVILQTYMDVVVKPNPLTDMLPPPADTLSKSSAET